MRSAPWPQTVPAPRVAAAPISHAWMPVAAVLIVGYLSAGRSFAHLGVPPLGLFLGEIVLGAFVLLHFWTFVERWGAALLVPSRLSGLMWALALFWGYGIVELVLGLTAGYHRLTALQCVAFNYYTLYLFLGLSIGLRDPEFLSRLVRPLGWVHGLYGLAWLLVLSDLPLEVPGTRIRLFGQPMGTAIVPLALLAVERPSFRSWPAIRRSWPLLLNTFVLLAVQVRAQWLAFLAGLVAYAWLTGNLRRVLAGTAAVAMLIGAMSALNVDIPSPRVRGGSISVRSLAARALAPLDPALASRYSGEAQSFSATASWRTRWWTEIWEAVHEEPARALVGFGYGFPLPSVAPGLPFPGEQAELEAAGKAVRTPHNALVYALAYGGWVGVLAFLAVQAAIVGLLVRSYRRSGQPFGLVLAAAAFTEALFTSYFESPYGAIPFYLLAGFSLAPALGPRSAIRSRAPCPQEWTA